MEVYELCRYVLVSLALMIISQHNHLLTYRQYSIFTLSLEVSRFKLRTISSQLYHTDTHVQVLIAFNPIRSGLFQTANDPGGGGGGGL